MCGVFGFVAMEPGEPINLRILSRVARETMRRGPHAWGLAWVDSKDRLHMFKQSGRIVDALGLLSMAKDAQMLIGHCRYATHGAPDDNRNNHPHVAGDGWIVHNGVISQYRTIVREHGLTMRTACDSEVLGLLIDQLPGPLKQRCSKAARIAEGGPLAMLGLWKDRLIAVRQDGQPLHLGETRRACYLASLPDGLPGDVELVDDDRVLEFK